MNSCTFLGRLVAEPELTHSSKEGNIAICRYTIAVDRRFSKEENKADFIKIVAFGKAGEFASKYFHKGKRVLVQARYQTEVNEKDGKTYYNSSFIAENQEFADAPNINTSKQEINEAIMDGFTSTTDNVEDEFPFN